jgi:tetratricopeptide (TPR) repeat protein
MFGLLFVTFLATSLSPLHADRKLLQAADQNDHSLRYTKQWAIVIGVNYADRDDVRSVVSPLKNAEADAMAVAKVLVDQYGYSEQESSQTLHLLLGKQATKREIESLFGRRFLKDEALVGKDDSVLIFFAGHGDREKRANLSQMLIYPYDVQAVDGKGIDDTTCVSLGTILEQLKFCAARHKLVVLDSCHSGEIFDEHLTRSTSRLELDPDLFGLPVLQAMTAAAGSQQAQDGDRHSPFTEALLEALEGRSIQKPVFGASAVINSVAAKVPEINSRLGISVRQSPRGGALEGGGEFYFFRTQPLPIIDDKTIEPQRLALLTLPGLSGRWWFEETPWLTPSVRSTPAVANALPALVTALKPVGNDSTVPRRPRTALETSDVAKLRDTLRESVQQYANQRSREENQALGALLQLSSQELSEAEVERLLGLFDSSPDAHLKAAVHHRLNQDDAGQLYAEALDAYESGAQATRGPQMVDKSALLRLCYADYGRFLMDVTGDTVAARVAFEKALASDESKTLPPLFVVDALLLRSRAEAMAGLWKAADESLEEALRVANDNLPPGHPLLAVVHDQFGWMNMDRWQLDEAERHFQQALEIRRSILAPDIALQVQMFHNEHGLAMVDRFSGQIVRARERYSRLQTEIEQLLPLAASRYESELVYGRLVNTLERLADCYLYASPPDAAAAFDTLDVAIELCRYLSPQLETRTRSRLQCKNAAALALTGHASDAHRIITRVKEEDYKSLIGNQSQELDLFWNAADALVQLAEEPEKGRLALRSLFATSRSMTGGVTVRRQQWEVLLWAGQMLLGTYENSEDSSDVDRDADRLLEVVTSSAVNRTNLRYLRPYLDCSLKVKLARPDVLTVRRTARQILLAQSGTSMRDVSRSGTTVIFYLDHTQGRVVILPERNTAGLKPTVWEVPFGNTNYMAAALPETVLAEVAKMPPPIEVHWSDIGVEPALTTRQFPFGSVANWTVVGTE